MKIGGADTLKPTKATRRASVAKLDARRAAVSAFLVWQRQRDTKRLTFPGMSRPERAAERS
jgi:hypothetical protein